MKTFFAFATVVIALVPARVGGELCTLDVVPAATLFVPYFEVNVSEAACTDPTAGADTIIQITNAAFDSRVAHVTIWTDWGIPTLDFDIYLTGYDMQGFGMHGIFCNGALTQTGTASGFSPVGPVSEPHIEFPGCNNTNMPGDPPFFIVPFSQFLIDQLQTWHTGRAGAVTGDCAGRDHGDEIARGFVTIDLLRDCSILFPSSSGYFDGSNPRASFDNVLLGDVLHIGAGRETLSRRPAVHIEAGPAGEVGPHTFYGRYTLALGAGLADRREPLPVGVGVRFDATVAGFDETELRVWREPGINTSAVACGTEPSGLPLESPDVLIFDEMENAIVASPAAPDVVNRYTITNDADPAMGGWAILDLSDDNQLPIYGDRRAQSWATAVSRAASPPWSVQLDGVPFGTALCSSSTPTLPRPVVFADGFESGGTSAWSSTTP